MNANELSTAALAYLGDSVIELLVREKLVSDGFSDSGNLNRESLKYVKAGAQAAAMRNILPSLNEEEEADFKRGRNMSGGNVPKSATMSEYRTATGMEVDTKLFSVAFMVTSVPLMGEITLPLGSTCSRARDSCSTLDLAFCIPASSCASVELRVAMEDFSCRSA